jgi:superfamily II RNA helicase
LFTLLELEAAEVVAVLSALIFQRKTAVEPSLPDKLGAACAALEDIATAVAHAQLKGT